MTIYVVMKYVTEVSEEYHTENTFAECAFVVEAEAREYVKAAKTAARPGVMYCYEECELHASEVPA